jgi:formate hydrogenlyase subunit 3/multisubunit Na+/H+ antiporter MnhD subunit
MTGWMLAGLLTIVMLLAVPAAMGRVQVVWGGMVLANAGFVILALLALAQGPASPLLLPFGPPWAPLSLGLDGLSAWFLLLLGISGLLAGLAGWAKGGPPPRRLMLWPLLQAGLALTLLAADAFGLLLGFALAGFAAHALISAEGAWTARPRARGGDLLVTLLAVAGLAGAVGLLTGLSGDLSFAGLRATPPEGGRAAAILLLVLPAAGARAVLPLLAPAPPGPALLLVAGGMPPVALYVLARLLLDLGGPAQPLWWSAALVLAGAFAALAGALRALKQPEIGPLLGGVALHHLGLVTMALGLLAALRAADLAPLAAVAAAAALLHLLAQNLFLALLWLAAAELSQGAGSRHLDRLGGLIHAMPVVACAALAGVAAAAMLPPLSGFAGMWLLLQASFAAWRVGSLGFQLLVVLAVAMLGLSIATLASALLRFWGLAFLGRPRTPRTLGAQEAAALPRGLLLVLAALALVTGMFPGPLLRLAEPALLLLAGHGGAPDLGWLTLGAGQGAASYAPLAVAILLAVLLGVIGAAMRRASPQAAETVPLWDDGFIAPPPHLPFGEPATQPGAAGMALPMRPPLPVLPDPALITAWLRGRWPAWRPPAPGGSTSRAALRLCLGALVGLLLLLAWFGTGP